MRRLAIVIALAALAACSRAGQTGTDAGATADDGPTLPRPDVGALPDVPFTRPDAAYVPSPGTCGFTAPAFC